MHLGAGVCAIIRSNFMKIANKSLVKFSLLAAFLCSPDLLLAQSLENQEAPPRPPREALDACKSLSANQACRFNSTHGTVVGSCWAPEGKPLACKPKAGSNNYRGLRSNE
jgi:hypothetical protein